jgi:molybdopterin-guanine dinucleotide biosynthesis protein B
VDVKTIGFIGYSNSGKTTLIERLIPLFRGRGLSVSAIKNAHHGFDMDRPGKDSFRYREAGAGQVLIATALRWALLTETPERASTLDELLARLEPCDLVIIEGFKSEGHMPRIEVRRSGIGEPPIFPHDPNVIAVASDHTMETALPVLDLNAPVKIADFVATHLGLA